MCPSESKQKACCYGNNFSCNIIYKNTSSGDKPQPNHSEWTIVHFCVLKDWLLARYSTDQGGMLPPYLACQACQQECDLKSPLHRVSMKFKDSPLQLCFCISIISDWTYWTSDLFLSLSCSHGYLCHSHWNLTTTAIYCKFISRVFFLYLEIFYTYTPKE